MTDHDRQSANQAGAPAAAPSPYPDYGPPISLASAKKVIAAAEAEAARNGWPMTIAVLDSTANLVLLERMDQANLGSLAVAQQKAETAVKFRQPTKVYDDLIAKGGVALRILSIPSIVAIEGGIPLTSNGRVVGSIGVSGMSPTQDALVAQAGAAALT